MAAIAIATRIATTTNAMTATITMISRRLRSRAVVGAPQPATAAMPLPDREPACGGTGLGTGIGAADGAGEGAGSGWSVASWVTSTRRSAVIRTRARRRSGRPIGCGSHVGRSWWFPSTTRDPPAPRPSRQCATRRCRRDTVGLLTGTSHCWSAADDHLGAGHERVGATQHSTSSSSPVTTVPLLAASAPRSRPPGRSGSLPLRPTITVPSPGGWWSWPFPEPRTISVASGAPRARPAASARPGPAPRP